MLHHIGLIGFLDSLHQDLALYIPAVDIIIFKIPVSSGDHRLSNKAFDQDPRPFKPDLQQFSGNISAVNPVDHISQIGISGTVEPHLPVYHVFERNILMGQGQLFHVGADIPGFCHGSFQKFCPGGGVKEQIPHQHGSAVWSADLFQRFFPAPLYHIPDADHIFRRLGDHFHLGDRRNTGQSLPPKSQRGNLQQILHLLDLAGGMAEKSQPDLILGNAVSIVRHPDKGNASFFDLHGYRRSSGVNGVLHQLLYHRSRPLHHLAGRYFIYCVLV